MAAPLGNKFWKKVVDPGRPLDFETPQHLETAAISYFEYVFDNPRVEIKLFHYQGDVIEHKVYKLRAPTIKGLCKHIGITNKTWKTYGTREDFLTIVDWIENTIWCEKVEGVAAGQFESNIIIRELGLVDRQDVTSDDEPITLVTRRIRYVEDKS